MSKKLPYTPNSRIRQALRLLWMRSRERGEALRNTGYTCSVCGVKQTAAKGREVKLDVHHLDGCLWEQAIEAVRKCILHPPERLCPLCKDCHGKMHPENKRKEP